MRIELRHLRTLAAVRDSRTLAEAAGRVHLSQSALSHQLRELEERLGCGLVDRDRRPVRLTAAGERLAALADRVLPLVAEAERDLARMAEGETGRLHIAIECHSCFEWLLPTLEAYRARWPEVELDLTASFAFEPLPALLRGDLDLVVTSDPQDLAGVAYEPLFRYQMVLVVAPGHRLAGRRWARPADLASETLITYPVDESRLDVYRRFLQPAGVRPARRRTSELTVMLVQLAASGRGVAALPDWAVSEQVRRGQVATVPLGPRGLWGTLHAAVRAPDAALAYVRDFVETARAVSFGHLEGIRPVAEAAAPARRRPRKAGRR